MQTDDENKARPVVVRKKSEGWREREESRAAGVAPRRRDERDQPTLVRC